MVLEYCPYGNLHALSIFTKPFEEGAAFVVLRQIASTLRLMHKEEILHLDIKEANILLTRSISNENKPECGKVPIQFKLADLGVSRDLSTVKSTENAVYHRGTPRYMAPEQLVQGHVKDPYKVEVYSLGVVLFRLIFKAYPFSPSAHED